MANGELKLSEATQMALGEKLFEEGLFGIKDHASEYIKLKSERLSPHYLDIRAGLSSYATRRHIAEAMAELYIDTPHPRLEANYIVGSPEAMTSYGASIADELRKGLLQPRVALDKARGNKSPILGAYKPGEYVAAFDDVLTDGETKIDTIRTLSAAHLRVLDYYVVLDREEGGSPQVEAATGLLVTPALGVSSLTRMLRSTGRITRRQYDNVSRYIDEYGEPHAQERMNTAL